MLSTLCWVPRGSCAIQPVTYEPSPEELDMLAEYTADMNLNESNNNNNNNDIKVNDDDDDDDDDEMDLDNNSNNNNKVDKIMEELNMDDYDEEPVTVGTMFLAGTNLTVHADNKDDPYITLPDDEDNDEDEDDIMVKPTDSIILTGKTEDEQSCIQMHIFDNENMSLYVHHDFMLPAFPLSIAWMNYQPKSDNYDGSFVAVSTFNPEIEIWNLDVLDALEPVCTLGGRHAPSNNPLMLEKSKRKNKKKKKKKKQNNLKDTMLGELKEGSHADAVLSLSWHKNIGSNLVSGSADKTVKLWDLKTLQCINTYTHHQDKVQAVEINPQETNILLSGSYDHNVCMLDTRTNNEKPLSFKLDADVEYLKWNLHNAAIFAVSTESGMVQGFDARKGSLFRLDAHSKATTGISFCAAIDGLMATASLDKTVKLWDLKSGFNCVATKNMEAGSLFAVDFYADSPTLLAACGNNGRLAIWDIFSEKAIEQKYRK